MDVFEECFRQYSLIPVESVLELGCGHCPHMAELAKRGYRYTGIDLSKPMIDYSKRRSAQLDGVNLLVGDMVDFSMPERVDFVFILLGSLYVTSTEELHKHFDAVGRALREGGLYFLDWCIQYEVPWACEGGDSWELERKGVKVRTTVSWKAVNPIEQTFLENITLDVDDHGRRKKVVGEEVRRAIYPQEFLAFVAAIDGFEFVGWWNNWDLSQPLRDQEKLDRPIALLRRV